MKVRIQPLEIEVLKEKPFANDLLERQEFVEILSNLIGNFDGPCVLALDAIWGAGKSTFLKMWTQHLRNHKFPVVEFNAWETDFSGEPLLALVAELTEGLGQYDPSLKQRLQKIRKTLASVANLAIRVFPPHLLVHMIPIPGFAAIAEKGVDALLSSHFGKRLDEYSQARESLHDFRNVLQSLSESKDGRPLVIIIDELDRCRPSYAIALLEIVKHLFMVDNVVFVLAINRDQLANSIKALYGNCFNAKAYLERFFDLNLRLPPTQGRENFIRAKLEKMLQFPKNESAGDCHRLLVHFFRSDALSAREIERAILHLRLVFASIPENNRYFTSIITVLLIARTLDSDIYHRFIHKQISDQQFADAILKQADLPRVPCSSVFNNTIAYFESVIIVGPNERQISDNRGGGEWSSPLLKSYEEKAKETSPDGKYAEQVITHVRRLEDHCRNSQFHIAGGLGFEKSIRRLELLSPELTKESAESDNP